MIDLYIQNINNFLFFERVNNMDNLETIKKDIRTINPIFTDELLNLLYEYLFLRHLDERSKSLKSIKEDITLRNKIKEVTISTIKK